MLSAKLFSKCRSLTLAVKNVGWSQTVFNIAQRIKHRAAEKGRSFEVLSKSAGYPLNCRAGTSDLQVFGQIFVQREYRCLDDVPSAQFIIDCGANVGYSAAYFLSRYPGSTVLCVEPDSSNFAVLQSNLKPYRDRARALRSAVWSGSAGLVISDETFGDGREWARTVREARVGESATIQSIDIGTLIRDSGFERVSILKIDIEGAEETVFSAGYEEWLPLVDNLVIELHGDRCEAVFHRAIAQRGYAVSRCDELTVCRPC